MNGPPPILHLVTFGYDHAPPPVANLVLDVRWMPDPISLPEYADLSGRDTVVQEWLCTQPRVEPWLMTLLDLLEPYLREAEQYSGRAVTMAIGCKGGHNRSVAIGERITTLMSRTGLTVSVHHRDIHRRSGRTDTTAK
ncbi:RapZ C-terminal domain-containing protein [Amycolatopsis aidingensis]|uniref:RapZ C-terminal domain-containing protein n=1 Tax=Amycolatopsis aidingensis TaxID=2842453 RepID=UPI001C0C527F|nr:RNase adapter RapZ [Amycolatopsis aidingensis]